MPFAAPRRAAALFSEEQGTSRGSGRKVVVVLTLLVREARGDHGDADDAAHVVVDLRAEDDVGVGV